MYLEAVDLMEPRLICVAQIVKGIYFLPTIFIYSN